MKKLLTFALAAMMLLTLSACDAEEKDYTVAICQFDQHPALSDAAKGFQDAVKEQLGDSVTFQAANAYGNAINCTTIAKNFVSDKVDLIFACSTPALQTVASATKTIPVLGTAVTDYASALGLTNWDGTVGGNVSGTSDLAPLDQQAAALKEMFPHAKAVGLVYCSGEPNSQYQVDQITGHLKKLGLTCKTFPYTGIADLSSVTKTACETSDVIYIPTDNTAAVNTKTIADVTIAAGVPVFAGEAGLCGGCGAATLSISYYDLGYQTGMMAVEILTGKKSIASLPVEYASETAKLYNAKNCAAQGVMIPEGWEPLS